MKKLPFFPTLGTVVKKSFSEVYSSMGLSILISSTWCLGFLPILFMLYGFWGGMATTHGLGVNNDRFMFFGTGMLIIAFWNGLFTGPLTTAWYSLYQARKTDYPSFGLFVQLFKKHYWCSAGIHWLFSGALVILLLNMLIAVRNSNLLLTIAGTLSTYILLLVSLCFFYFHPLIQLDNTFKKVVKKSFLLVLDNFGLSLWMSLILSVLFLFSILLVFPLLLIYGAVVIYMIDKGFELIYQKYDE